MSERPAWRTLDAPSPYPVGPGRPSRCPDDEVVEVDPEPGRSRLYVSDEGPA